MSSTSDRPFKDFSVEQMAELFWFVHDMYNSVSVDTNRERNFYTGGHDLSEAREMRMFSLCMLKVYAGLGMIKEPENRRLSDLSMYDLISVSCNEEYDDDSVSECIAEDLNERVLEGSDNFGTDYLTPDREDFLVHDEVDVYDYYSAESDNEDACDEDLGLEQVFDCKLPERISANLAEMITACRDSGGTIGLYRLTIIKSSLVGRALKLAEEHAGDELGDLLGEIVTGPLMLTNYFAGFWLCDELADDTWWAMIPNVYDWDSGDGYENTDYFQNPAFPFACHMAIECAERLVAAYGEKPKRVTINEGVASEVA